MMLALLVVLIDHFLWPSFPTNIEPRKNQFELKLGAAIKIKKNQVQQRLKSTYMSSRMQ